MKNYYFRNSIPVNVGDMIKIDGIDVFITPSMILANPNQFMSIKDVNYVECINWNGNSHEKGVIYPVINDVVQNQDGSSQDTPTFLSTFYTEFKPATFEHYVMQQLLQHAKDKFSVGTKFIPTSVILPSETFSTIEKDTTFFWNPSHEIISTSLCPGDVYHRKTNTWATIIKESKPTTPEYVKIKVDVKQGTGRWAAQEPGRIYKVESFRHCPDVSGNAYFVGDQICINPEDCEPCNKEEYELQELIKEVKARYKIGDVVRSAYISNSIDTIKSFNYAWPPTLDEIWIDGNTLNIQIYSSKIGWVEVLKPLAFTTDGKLLYEGSRFYRICGDFTIVSEIMKSVFVDGNDLARFADEAAAKAYVKKNRKKTVDDYENLLLHDDEEVNENFMTNKGELYYWFKENEPDLYWKKVLQLIADDLNGEWEPDWHSDESKYSIEIDLKGNIYGLVRLRPMPSSVYFKSLGSVKKAIDIMGSNLTKLF